MKPIVLDIDQNGRVDVLHDFLADSLGFSLALIHAPPGPVRDELLRRLRVWAGKDGVPPLVEVHLAASEWPHERLQALSLENAERTMVVLTGLEQYAFGDRVSPVLARLNLARDLLPEWIPGPLVIIASDETFTSLWQSAPDLVTWRGFELSVQAVTDSRMQNVLPLESPKLVSAEGSTEIAELTNLLQGILARPHGDLEVAGLRLRLGRALIEAYRYSEGEAELAYAAQVFAKEGRKAAEAEALYWRGRSALARSEHETARRQFETALSLCQGIGHIAAIADCIHGLGDVAFERSDDDTARLRYEQALSIYQQIGAIGGQADCVCALGNIALRRSDHEMAKTQYEMARGIYQLANNVRGQAHCITGLAQIAQRHSDLDAAASLYEQALPLYKMAHDFQGEANCIFLLGESALRRFDMKSACARYEESLLIYQRVGDVQGEANCIFGLGEIARHNSEFETARLRYEEALPLYKKIGALLGQANSILRLGRVASAREDHKAAREYYEQGLLLFQTIGDSLGEANCIRGLGELSLTENDSDGARALFERALRLYERFGDPYSIGLAHHDLSRVADTPELRNRHIEAARQAWKRIARDDLIAKHLDNDA